jgi:ferrochelatase
LRQYFNHPGFIDPMVDAVNAAIATLPKAGRSTAHLAFVAHSIPNVMDVSAGPDGGAYAEQLIEAAALVASEIPGEHVSSLSFCSRSGSPSVPWLEPDINDRLGELRDHAVGSVVIIPIGFVSDHMEVAYDLDTEAAATASKFGLDFARAGTAGTDPRFVAMVRELVLERMGQLPARALGDAGPAHDVCPVDCCRMPERPARPAAVPA